MDVFRTELVSFLQYRPILLTTLVHTACFAKRQREADRNAVHVYEDLCAPAAHGDCRDRVNQWQRESQLISGFCGVYKLLAD